MASFSENGGALQSPSLFPVPANLTSTTTSGRRRLLQTASGTPYVDSHVQVLCQSCNDTSALLTALNGSGPSSLLMASGMCCAMLSCHATHICSATLH